MSYGYGTHYTPNRIMGRPTIPDDPNACGTNRGIWQHKRAGQKNCDKCREKQNANRRASYRAQMERKRHTDTPGNTQPSNRNRRVVVAEITLTKNTISSASRYAKQTAPAVLLTLKSGASPH